MRAQSHTRGGHAPCGVVVVNPFKKRQTGGHEMAQRWNDWRDWRDYAERVGRLYDEAAPRRARYDEGRESELEHADWTPASDIIERENEFVIALDLPGIERDALDVSVNDDRLTVRGERAQEEGVRKSGNNRPSGRFLAKFGPLPQSVDRTKIAAEYKDGVLRLRLPKRAAEQAGRVKIEIQ
jgi:HSP20 family protein